MSRWLPILAAMLIAGDGLAAGNEEKIGAPTSESVEHATPRDYWLEYHPPANWRLKYVEWVWKDPVNLASRPVYWRGGQWRTVGLELALVGVLFPLDDPARDLVQNNRDPDIEAVLDPIRGAYTGDRLELYGVGALVIGLITGHEKLADTGFLAAESVFYATLLSRQLKWLTQRERPKYANDQYEFNGPGGSTRHGSSSFVSGEVIGAFAFAASVSEVWQSAWVTWPLYGLAGAVAAHRLEHDAHWLTDVVAAGLLGHAIGKSLARLHYPREERIKIEPFVARDAVGLQATLRF